MKATFSTTGLESWLEDIAQVGNDIDASAARALTAGAQVALTGMEELVPVDRGDLKDELKIDGPYQDGNLISIDVGLIDAPKEIQIYGTVQEYGSPSKRIPAQSYIRAGWDRLKARVMQTIKASLKADGMVN